MVKFVAERYDQTPRQSQHPKEKKKKEKKNGKRGKRFKILHSDQFADK